MKRKQSGFSLLDITVSLLLVSLMVAIAWSMHNTAAQQSASSGTADGVTRIEDAIVAFAQMHGRLPYAGDTTGLEQTGNQAGPVPFVSLGEPNYQDLSFTYTPYPVQLSDGSTSALTEVAAPWALQFQQGLQPVALMSPLQEPSADGRPYDLIGLCQRLLHPQDEGKGNALAFSLSIVSTSVPGGNQQVGGLSVKELASRLSCAALVAASTRTYFNVLAAWGSDVRNFEDFQVLTGYEDQLANVDLANGLVAATVSGPMKVFVKQQQLQQAQGACEEDESKCTAMDLAAVALTEDSAYEALNVAKVARYTLNLADADANVASIAALLATADANDAAVSVRALDSVSGAAYLP